MRITEYFVKILLIFVILRNNAECENIESTILFIFTTLIQEYFSDSRVNLHYMYTFAIFPPFRLSTSWMRPGFFNNNLQNLKPEIQHSLGSRTTRPGHAFSFKIWKLFKLPPWTRIFHFQAILWKMFALFATLLKSFGTFSPSEKLFSAVIVFFNIYFYMLPITKIVTSRTCVSQFGEFCWAETSMGGENKAFSKMVK